MELNFFFNPFLSFWKHLNEFLHELNNLLQKFYWWLIRDKEELLDEDVVYWSLFYKICAYSGDNVKEIWCASFYNVLGFRDGVGLLVWRWLDTEWDDLWDTKASIASLMIIKEVLWENDYAW